MSAVEWWRQTGRKACGTQPRSAGIAKAPPCVERERLGGEDRREGRGGSRRQKEVDDDDGVEWKRRRSKS